ncbi:hypothetical protein JW960_16740 [candidate division KSB1 bacterium]|nr:hypothetical protein [candidate division KSB1 bacterium]
MGIDDLRDQVLGLLKQRDLTGRELIKTFMAENKEKVKALGIEKYDLENPASMGNFIAIEIMPYLGQPVYKEKINVRGNKQTLYSLNNPGTRTEVKPRH